MLDRRSIAGLTALLSVRALGDVWLLLRDPQRFTNHEEAYNATVGWVMWHTGSWDQLLDLQYRSFCGGCTVVSTLAAPTLGLFGDSFLVWKGLALVIALMGMVLGFFAVRSVASERAAWVAAACLALPPAGLSELGLMLWGNHQETALFLLATLALRGRPLAQGLVIGLGVAFCRTSLYFAVVLLPWAMKSNWRALGTFLLGLTPLLIQAGGDFHGRQPMNPDANLMPHGIEGVWERITMLVDPRQLASRMFLADGAEWLAALVLSCSGVAAAVQLKARRWLLPSLALSFAIFFCISGFRLPLDGQGLPPVNARYHAPWILLLTLMPAFAPGRWKALAAPLVLAGLLARPMKPAWKVDTETLLSVRAAQPWSFLGLSAGRLDPQGLTSNNRRVNAMLTVLSRDIPPEWESVSVAMLHKRPREGWGEGLWALERCHDPSHKAFVACLEKRHLNAEGRFGVGLGLMRDWTPTSLREQAIDALGPETLKGTRHALAGVDRPLVLPDPKDMERR